MTAPLVDLHLNGHLAYVGVTLSEVALLPGLCRARRGDVWVLDFAPGAVHRVVPHVCGRWPVGGTCACGASIPGPPEIDAPRALLPTLDLDPSVAAAAEMPF